MAKASTKVQETSDPNTGEIMEGNVSNTSIAQQALTNAGLVGSTFNTKAGTKFKVKSQVTHSVLRQKDNETIFVKFLDKIYTGEELKNTRAGQPKMEPARLVKVIDLNRPGEIEALIIVNKVLEGELARAYPNDGYVGKSCAITMLAAQEGTRYKRFEVYEIELEAGE